MPKTRQPSPKLDPLLTTKATRQREFSKRKDAFVSQSVHPADVAELETDGWVVQREGNRKVRLKKPKSYDRALEDQVWCLFYRMGYHELGGPRFKISYLRKDGTTGEKQVDVFAKDDETVVVVECKARETRGKRSLQRDLHETESLQKPFATSIRAHYGAKFRPKIVWMYVTNNIIWSEPDLERAAAINVRVVTENELQYFDSFIKHMGTAGRFQFLAEFLAGQEIPGLENVRVPATRGQLGKHKFYSFVTTPRHLLKIAFVNHLALDHPDGRPAYQRMIAPSRIREIGGFIKRGGFFPTNLLVNFVAPCRFDFLSNKENVDPSIKFGWLYLPNRYKSAWIIDGQHRLYGYSNIDEQYWDQNIAVIAFEKMDTKDEADLFVTINHKQKSVPKSVIVALQSDLKWGSDDPRERLSALSSRLVKTLNSDPTSPLFQRFVVQGVVSKENQSLTMPEIVNGLNRSGLLGKMLQKGLLAPGPLSGATDEETNDRARRVLNRYFHKLRDANSVRWDAARKGYVSTNPGVRAHLQLIAEAVQYLHYKENLEAALLNEDVLAANILRIVKPVFGFVETADEADIYDRFSRKFGEGGVREYTENLAEIVTKSLPAFGSGELRVRLAQRSDERVKEMNQQVIQLVGDLTDFVFDTLKKTYGSETGKSGVQRFWEEGIESPKIKAEAFKRMAEDKMKNPPETYVDLIDLKTIVTQKNNWPHFEAVLSIPMREEQKGKAHYVGWMLTLNELRRIGAHPSAARTYKEEDFAFFRHLKREFYVRRNAALGLQEE